MYRDATSKKRGGVENCSFRTKRSFFDFLRAELAVNVVQPPDSRFQAFHPSSSMVKNIDRKYEFLRSGAAHAQYCFGINFRTATIVYKHNALRNKFDILS